MKSEYKRDINGNYLVLYENEEPDTSSYQMRMLVGNSIPSILKCRVQGVDGQFMVCYDITSKQSLLSLYEEKKMGYEDRSAHICLPSPVPLHYLHLQLQ